VSDVIFPGPEKLHWNTGTSRDLDRLEHEIELRLPAEGTPEQGDSDRYPPGLDAKPLGNATTHILRILHRRPDLAPAIVHPGDRDRRLHGDVREHGGFILGFDARTFGVKACSDIPAL
jgi:hypothetical protein